MTTRGGFGGGGDNGNVTNARRGRGGSSRGGKNNEWNPMKDDFQDPSFNTYTEGPGQGHRPYSNKDEMWTLFVGNVPLNLDENGLMNLFSTCGASESPLAIRFIASKGVTSRKCGFVEYAKHSDAETAIRKLNGAPPYNLNVNYKLTPDEKKQRAVRKSTGAPNVGEEQGSTYRLPDEPVRPSRGVFQAEGTTRSHFEIRPAQVGYAAHNLACEPGTDSFFDNAAARDFRKLDLNMMDLGPAEGGSLINIYAGNNGRTVSNGRGYQIPSIRRTNDMPHSNRGSGTRSAAGNHPNQEQQQQSEVNTMKCGTCGQPSKHMCVLCKVAPYCSEYCARQQWAEHKAKCILNAPPPGIVLADKFLSELESSATSPRSSAHKTLLPLPEVGVKVVDKSVAAACNGAGDSVLTYTPKSTVNLNKQFSPQPPGSRSVRNRLQMTRVLAENGPASSTMVTPAAVTPKKLTGWTLTEELVIGQVTEVLVITVIHNCLWVTKIANKPAIKEMVDELYEKRTMLRSREMKIGDICAALYEGAWYRAKVVSVKPCLELFYIDFGNTATIALKDVRTLPPEFNEMKAQAIKVVLTNGTQETQLCDKNIFIKALRKMEDGTTYAELQGKLPITGKQSPYFEQLPHVEQLPRVEQLPQVLPRVEQSPCISPRVEQSHGKQLPGPLAHAEQASLQEQTLEAVAVANMAVGVKNCEELPADIYSEVTISILDGQDYWVTLTSRSQAAAQLVEDLNCQPMSLVPCNPTVGDIVAAQYSEGGWYRAEILSLSPLNVLFIDFGNKESTAETRILPVEFSTFPAQAIKVRLHTSTSTECLKLCEEEKVLMKPVGMDDGCVVVEVKKFKDVLVAKPEVLQAKVQHPKLPVITSIVLPPNVFTDVQISYQGKKEYYVHIVANIPVLYDLVSKMQAAANLYTVCSPTVGLLVAGLFDGAWFRGKVTSVQPLKVIYLDYGNEENVTLESIRSLPETFFSPPAQAVKIILKDGTSEKYFNLGMEANLAVKPEGKVGDTMLVSVKDDVTVSTPQLSSPQPSSPQSSALQVSPSQATTPQLSLPQCSVLQSTVQHSSALQSTVPHSSALQSSTAQQASVLLASTLQVVPAAEPALKESLPINTWVELPTNKFTEVQVSNPGISKYFVQIVQNAPLLDDLILKMQAAVSSYTVCVPTVGCLVAALFDGGWFRGRVTCVVPLKVMYLDYGNEEKATLDSIRNLPESFCSLPAQAIKISLKDGTAHKYMNLNMDAKLSVKAERKVGDATLVTVKDEIAMPADQVTASASAVPPTVEVSIPQTSEIPEKRIVREKLLKGVETEVTVTTAGGQTFWICFVKNFDQDIGPMHQSLLSAYPSLPVCSPKVGNYVAVAHGGLCYRAEVMAVVDSSSTVTCFFMDFGFTDSVTLDAIRFLPEEFRTLNAQAIQITLQEGTPDKYLHLEEDDTLTVKAMKKIGSVFIVEVKADAAAVAPVSRPSIPTVELPFGNFTPVFISSKDGEVIYVQMSSSASRVENLVSNSADLKCCNPSVGDYVVVLFEESWYRAKVLSLVPTITVRFIDYGNEDVTVIENIRELPAEAVALPAQAVKIKFSANTPEALRTLSMYECCRVKPIEKAADGTLTVLAE